MLRPLRLLLVTAGTIIIGIPLAYAGYVLAKPSLPPEPPVFVRCSPPNEDYRCYRSYFAAATDLSGPSTALASLKALYARKPVVVANCHQLTHIIGNTAFQRIGDVNDAFREGDAFCWSGYYHGVIEEAVRTTGEAEVTRHLNDYCADIPGKERYSFDYYNCVHGLGHGLMAMTDNELFDSLALCDTLLGDWERRSCQGGVFMENVMADLRKHGDTKFLDPARPLYPCTDVEERYKEQCYLMQTSYALSVVPDGDFRAVFSLCQETPIPYDAICAQSLGRDASGQTASDPVRTWERCALAPTERMLENCIEGAVKDIISYFHDNKTALIFCSLAPEPHRSTCESTAAEYYRSFE